MAEKITGVEDGAYGYFLAGNCAGCNIFTFAPLIWANGGTVEPKDANDEPLAGRRGQAGLRMGAHDAQGRADQSRPPRP